MSNHSGSYMLNTVLKMLDQYLVYDMLGKEKSLELVRGLLKISHNCDCNSHEILEGFAEKLGICPYCECPTDEFQDGVCKKCHGHYFS